MATHAPMRLVPLDLIVALCRAAEHAATEALALAKRLNLEPPEPTPASQGTREGV